MAQMYVGGEVGGAPDVVSANLEIAMRWTVASHSGIGAFNDDVCAERWTCVFENEVENCFRCTTTITDADGESHDLYVEAVGVATVMPWDVDRPTVAPEKAD